MPDQNPFEAAYGKSAPVSEAPSNPGVSNPQGASGNPFESVYGAQNSQQKPQNADNGHGSLYNAANAVLNSRHEDPSTGNGILDKVGSVANTLGEIPMDLVRGAGKGALSTAAGAGSLLNRATGLNQPFNQENLSGLIRSNSVAEGAGKLGEQVGEFATGEGALAKAGAVGLSGKVLAGGALSGLQSGGDPIATAFGTALPAVMSSAPVKAAGKVLNAFLGSKAGTGESSLARAFVNPESSGLAQVMEGKKAATQVVQDFQKKVAAYADSARDAYRTTLDKVTSQTIPNWHAKAGQAIQDLNDKLTTELKKFGVDETKDGLDTKHMTGATEEEVKPLVDKIRNWGNEARDFTPSGLDTLKKQLSAEAYKTGSPLASRLADQLKGSLDEGLDGYKEMTSNYNDAHDLLREIKQEFGASGKSSDNDGAISRKIQNMLKQNTNFRELLMNKMPGGSQTLDEIAGLHLNSVLPKGILNSLLGAGSFHGLMFSSPRLMGEGARLAGKIAKSPNLAPVANTVRQTLSSGMNGALSGSQ